MISTLKWSSKYFQETIPFVPVSHLLWGVWGLLQMEVSPVGFGFAVFFYSVLLTELGTFFKEYGRDRLGNYFKNRQLLQKFTEKIDTNSNSI